jgi:hypothetical protein
MRASFVFIVILFFVQIALAGNGKKYGKALTIKEVTKISDILSKPEEFNGKRLLVEGSIVDVCKERGCWIKIASDKEFESLLFKVDDGVIVFPLDAKGRNTKSEGILSVKTYTVEQLIESGKKHAEKEKTEFDPTSIKGPKTVIMLKGEGAVVD